MSHSLPTHPHSEMCWASSAWPAHPNFALPVPQPFLQGTPEVRFSYCNILSVHWKLKCVTFATQNSFNPSKYAMSIPLIHYYQSVDKSAREVVSSKEPTMARLNRDSISPRSHSKPSAFSLCSTAIRFEQSVERSSMHIRRVALSCAFKQSVHVVSVKDE